MASLPKTRPLSSLDRRSFLWSLAAFALTAKKAHTEKRSETPYRFLTPECEVRMSVQYFANSSPEGLRFRNDATNRAFCLSSNGVEDPMCLERFVGSMAVVRYDFSSRHHSQIPLHLRERVQTIDQDSRLSPRPPFERVVAVEREAASDIQVFGYNPNDPNARPLAVWRLLRQDLYLNDQTAAFLIVHWKHTFNFISLLDLIPGDGTEVVG